MTGTNMLNGQTDWASFTAAAAEVNGQLKCDLNGHRERLKKPGSRQEEIFNDNVCLCDLRGCSSQDNLQFKLREGQKTTKRLIELKMIMWCDIISNCSSYTLDWCYLWGVPAEGTVHAVINGLG